MTCSSGNSPGMTPNMSNLGSEDDLLILMDQRKRKRIESNRESARRSRIRKQKHQEELTAHLAQLRAAKGEIVARIGITTQHLARVEAENAVLQAQMAELGQRLGSLNEILSYISMSNVGGGFEEYDPFMVSPSMNVVGRAVSQPAIAAAGNVFEYWWDDFQPHVGGLVDGVTKSEVYIS